MSIIPTISEVWRDYEIQGVPSSGARNPEKSEIRATLTDMDSRIATAVATTSLVYGTRAALLLNKAPANGARAEVRGDPTSGYNGVYAKSGPSGSGTWVRVADLPDDVVRLLVTGGTANAIVAAPSPQLPVTKGNKIYLLRPTATNTAAVTIDDGEGPVAIKTVFGNNLPANALLIDTENVLVWSVDHYRLMVSASVDASAILADAQAAAVTAVDAAAAVDLPAVTANTMLVDNAAGTARESKTFDEVRALLHAGLNQVESRTALKAINTSQQKEAYLVETGREGLFIFRPGDYSDKVTLDTQEGIYIPADDTASTSGAWIRQGPWAVNGMQVSWFGVVFDDEDADNTLPLQAALDFIHSTVKRATFSAGLCVYASTLDLDHTTGLILQGSSGGPTGGAAPGTVLRFTGAGDGTTCASSVGLNIRDIAIQSTNASLIGKVINATSDTSDTAFLTIERCTISAVRTDDGTLIELDKNINVRIVNCNLSGGKYQIHGAALAHYCNVIKIRDCQFVGYGANAINSSSGEEWTVSGCTFEQGESGHASGIVGSIYGLTVSGCYFGDSTAIGYWIDLDSIAGFICTGCMFAGFSASAATIGIRLSNTSVAFVIQANRFYTLGIGISIENGSDYGVVKANYFSGCTTKIVGGVMPNGETTSNYG